jgi:hypothetical protein
LEEYLLSQGRGILAYGSLIDEPGEEIAKATVPIMESDIITPVPIEFARTSGSRKGAPTLVPVQTGGAKARARIFVLRDDVTETQAQDWIWRRETRKKTGSYTRPQSPGKNDVVVERVDDFHGVANVYYTQIAVNIDELTPENLARLAIQSAKAVKEGKLQKGLDGISYLINAKGHGIVTALSGEYEAEVLRQTGAADLASALAKVSGN